MGHQFEAVHFRHVQIGHHEVDMAVVDDGGGLFAVTGGFDGELVFVVLQHVGQAQQEIFFIINE